LTDDAYAQALKNIAIGASIKASKPLLLTLSLGDLFPKTNCHYKLIAGVIQLLPPAP
jgi:hypothetical protein